MATLQTFEKTVIIPIIGIIFILLGLSSFLTQRLFFLGAYGNQQFLRFGTFGFVLVEMTLLIVGIKMIAIWYLFISERKKNKKKNYPV
ncbi:MAG: hypothetical protein HY832_00275 [Candidatus Aenigmarchaeota archaeon]|nr:hypothetical protein [Candidatus Aenigmarchaeota archaeon]